MKFQARVPRVVSSTVTAGSETSRPVLDGRDVIVPNHWQLPPDTVALVGRPAVWTALDIAFPEIPLGVARIPPKRIRFERIVMARNLLMHTCAEHEGALAVHGPDARSPWPLAAEGLIDVITGLWQAPIRARNSAQMTGRQ